MPFRIPFSVALVSMAAIACQLGFMRMLSIAQWHNFASLIIAIALLGFGTAGTCITLMRPWLLRHFESMMPMFMLLCAAAMTFSVRLSQAAPVRFDSFLLFSESLHVWRLASTCLVYFMPFFLGAMAIGLAFVRFSGSIGSLYCANLVGSGLGGILAIGLMWAFPPAAITAVIAMLPLAACIILGRSRAWAMAACVPAVFIGLAIQNPTELALSEFKALRKILEIPESRVVVTENSPYGLMQVVTSPALRYAPGVSLNFTGELPVCQAVFRDGDWFGPLIAGLRGEKETVLDFTPRALPYALGRRSRVLVLDSGTGADIVQAVSNGALRVDAVEPNPFATSLLESEFSAIPIVSMHMTNSRTFLMSEKGGYDLIVLPAVDAFGGTSGLYALAENYLFTREAAGQMWDRLNPGGVISSSVWLDYPPRNSLKLLATFADVLAGKGVDPRLHIAAARSWNMLAIAVKKGTLTDDDSSRIRGFSKRMSFDVTLLPDLKPGERTRYNALSDIQWLDELDTLLSPERAAFVSAYDFNIRPATDSRPYFSQFLTLNGLSRLREAYGQRSVPFFEISYMILILGLALLSVLSLALILLPLSRIGWKGKARPVVLVYFGSIAVGYMFIEIVLIQKFVLYLGNPIYAAAAVISAMLICSGIGSALSGRIPHRAILPLFGVAVVLIPLCAIGLGPLLQSSISAPLPIKALLAAVFIAPLAFCLGMPFPVGVSRLTEEAVSWAWGINGCISVISSASATVAAVELGFNLVMAIAAIMYAIALLSLEFGMSGSGASSGTSTTKSC